MVKRFDLWFQDHFHKCTDSMLINKLFLNVLSFLFTIRQPYRILLVVVYVGFIIALSLLPPQHLPKVPLFPGMDKLVHFMMYFIFSVLLCWALRAEHNYYRLLFIIPATIGWGILMEYFQLSMHAGRSFSWYDVLSNSIGVVSGVLVYVPFSLRFRH